MVLRFDHILVNFGEHVMIRFFIIAGKFVTIATILAGCGTRGGDPVTTAEESPLSQKADSAVQWLNLEGNKPHIVLISGDEEYRSEEALPQLAKILSMRHGFRSTVLFAQNPKRPGIVDPNYSNNIPGLHHLEYADLMVIFTRFRALPDSQMAYIEDYLRKGRPVLGIRTSTHAFNFQNIDFESSYTHYGNYYESNDAWSGGFGRVVLGEKWISHHGRHGHQSTRGIADKNLKSHPILHGIRDGDIWGPTDVYTVRLPLSGDGRPIVLGLVVDREGDFMDNDPRFGMRPTDRRIPRTVPRSTADGKEQHIDLNDPMMPIAWIRTFQIPNGHVGRAFTSTIGSSTDLLETGTRRLLVNAVYWCLDLEVPESANVEIVGPFEPSAFAFHDDSFWANKNLNIADLK